MSTPILGGLGVIVTLMFAGQPLGEVTFGAPDPQSGLRQGRLAPGPAYLMVRDELQVLGADDDALAGLEPEQVRERRAERLAILETRGLRLEDAGRPVPTVFLMVSDYYGPDMDLELLSQLGVAVAAHFAADT